MFIFFILKTARRWKKSSSNGLLLPPCCAAPPARHTAQHLLPSPLQPLNPSVAESFSQQDRGISVASCLPVGWPWLAVAGPGVRGLPQKPCPIHPCGYYTQFNKHHFCALLDVCQHLPIHALRCGISPVCKNGVYVVIMSLMGA